MRVNLKLHTLQAATGLALAVAAGTVRAQDLPPVTWDVQANHSQLSAGLPDGESLSVRASVPLPQGNSMTAELMQERKFGAKGGVLALAYTRVLNPDWFATGTLVVGNGGPNWAKWRTDMQISAKWLEQRQLVTSGALYHAVFDGGRSDSGLRLSAALYLADPAVLEAGVTFNLSQPGSVNSDMPYVALTLGREGQQYLSLRVSNGTEAYQALGTGVQLVNFHSRTVGATWRRWVGPQWGFTAQAEHYRNPTYQRQTLGLGLFAQW
ncbi:YaiO family outer membrane beta-barrel protein [Rhodoferax sp. WC2427]|uniref:YaiO family outer membrane beta-barrel protein n=1 Tax=Rhodoferax sp. WC2427 TaxID=3234144 RepID=UPI0034652588